MASFLHFKRFNSVSSFGSKTDNMVKSLNNIWGSHENAHQLKSIHEEVVNYLSNSHHFQKMPEIRKLHINAMNYNVGEYVAGFLINDMYETLANEQDLTSENIKLANVLGWCYEVMMAVFLMTDDVVDDSTIRRGKLAWHKRDGVGLLATNHSFMLESIIYLVLLRYFRKTNICTSLMEIFHDLTFSTFFGQTLDGAFQKNGRPQLELYTLDGFERLAYWKTGYPFFVSTFALTACLAGKRTKEFETSAKQVVAKWFGPTVQANNDFIGCFNTKNANKRDTDVTEGKCTWLVVRALEKVTPAQKQIIEAYYGRPGAEAALKIRNLYEELELPKDYRKYERERLSAGFANIKRLPNEEHRNVFTKVMKKLPNFFKYLDKYSDEEHGNARIEKLYS